MDTQHTLRVGKFKDAVNEIDGDDADLLLCFKSGRTVLDAVVCCKAGLSWAERLNTLQDIKAWLEEYIENPEMLDTLTPASNSSNQAST